MYAFWVYICISAQGDTGVLPQLIFSLFVDTGSLIEFGACHWLEVLAVEPLDAPVSASTLGTDITQVQPSNQLLHQDPNPGPYPVQTFYILSHLPSSKPPNLKK